MLDPPPVRENEARSWSPSTTFSIDYNATRSASWLVLGPLGRFSYQHRWWQRICPGHGWAVWTSFRACRC